MMTMKDVNLDDSSTEASLGNLTEVAVDDEEQPKTTTTLTTTTATAKLSGATWDRRPLCVFAIALVAAGGVLMLSLGTGPRGIITCTFPSPPPTPSPSESPTAMQVSPKLQWFLDTQVDARSASNKDSPQFLAAHWLIEEDSIFDDDNAIDLSPITLQRYALATFYFSTGGDVHWKKCGRNSPSCGGKRDGDGASWLANGGDDECDWFAVECDENGTVRSLNFPATGNDLNGTLPSELALLTGLRRLAAPENEDLTGRLEIALQGMTSLQTLVLHNNKLIGSLPSSFLAANPGLVELDVRDNELWSPIPKEGPPSTQLTSLRLGGNRFTGTIPSILGTLTALEDLDLRSNYLTGTIPEELFSLDGLITLSVSGNEALTGSISPLVGQLTDLKVLQLGGTGMGGPLPDIMFEKLLNLSELNLAGASFSGTISEKIRLWNSTMMDLFLNDNQFSGPIPEAFDDLWALETLQIQGNQLTGSISQNICAERGLRFQQLATLIVDCVVECNCCDSCEP